MKEITTFAILLLLVFAAGITAVSANENLEITAASPGTVEPAAVQVKTNENIIAAEETAAAEYENNQFNFECEKTRPDFEKHFYRDEVKEENFISKNPIQLNNDDNGNSPANNDFKKINEAHPVPQIIRGSAGIGAITSAGTVKSAAATPIAASADMCKAAVGQDAGRAFETQTLTAYVELGSDWDFEDIDALFLNGDNKQIIEKEEGKNYLRLNLKHF